jgi:pyoverdine/dityrosine biosynthesis protein Dit1
VTENGALRKVKKVDFNEKKVFLIDDFKTIYIWVGLKASKKKQDLSKKRANELNNKRENIAKIQIMGQNQEYGAILAIMDVLKEGLTQSISLERSPELEMEYKDTMELIEIGLDPDFEAEITVAAHKLSEEKRSYEELCRKLAELQLTLLKGEEKALKKDITKKAEEIYKSSSTYEELCRLIVELSILIEKKSLD